MDDDSTHGGVIVPPDKKKIKKGLERLYNDLEDAKFRGDTFCVKNIQRIIDALEKKLGPKNVFSKIKKKKNKKD